MKFYMLCDIEGVAGLSCWDEARPSGSLYPAMAREMSLEAACVAESLLKCGEHQIVIEDAHGDGRNIDCSLLPPQATLLRGLTHEIFGKTGLFDESFDGVLMVGFHDAASSPHNPTSHTMVSSRIFQLKVNGALWGEFEMFAYAAAYRGVPTLFVSGDDGVCAAAERQIPSVVTVPTKTGYGYGVLTKTPEAVQAQLAEQAEKILDAAGKVRPLSLPEHFHVEVTYHHHYDAYGCSHYPGAVLVSPTTLTFDTNDYGEVLRFFYFVF